MAAITSAQDGDWSSTATWTGGSIPGATDTATVLHQVVVSDARTVGNDASPGLTIGSGSLAGKILRVSSTGTLSCRGDMLISNSGHVAPCSLQVDGGGVFQFQPASAVSNSISFNNVGTIIGNGSSGSHATIKTDKGRGGLASLIQFAIDFRSGGLSNCAYTDFLDFGTATTVGLTTGLFSSADAIDVSITHCTFTRCSYQFRCDGSSQWDHNLTFQNNVFTSSVTLTLNGNASACGFTLPNASPTGTLLIDLNYFDTAVSNGIFKATKFTNNVINAPSVESPITFLGTSTWPDDTYFAGNVICGLFSGSGGITTYGSFKNCYIISNTSSNPHYVFITSDYARSYTVTGCIFEAPLTCDGTGDCIFPAGPAAGTNTFTAKTNIVLPTGSGNSSGKLVSYPPSWVHLQAIIEHNTCAGYAGEAGVQELDEGVSSVAGCVASNRSNLIWANATSATINIITSKASGGPTAVDAVTLAGYNAIQNPSTCGAGNPCYYNTTTAQTTVKGYAGLKVSQNNPFPNSNISSIGVGGTDIDITTSGPQFVDATRGLLSWSVSQGGANSVAGAMALLAANRGLISQATTGLLAWVRAGFRPKNALVAGASYSADALTTDAGGNAWNGGSSGYPDIGAMAYLAPAPPATNASGMLATF